MKTAVVYYSMSGNTQKTAEQIARRLQADLVPLNPVKAYPDKGIRKFFFGGKSAMMQETPALQPYAFDAARYGRVLLGSPVWAGNVAPPLRTFLKENRDALRGKRFAAFRFRNAVVTFAEFVCQGGSGAEKALNKIKEALDGAGLDAALTLNDPVPDPEKEKQIAAFCDALA